MSVYGLTVLNIHSRSSLGKPMSFSEHQNCLLCQNRTGFCFLQAVRLPLTTSLLQSHTQAGTLRVVWDLAFSSPVARALNYMSLILYNSVMLYYDSNVLMITKAFELLLSILQALYLNKNDALSSIHNHFLAKIFPVLLCFNDEGGCSVDCPLLMLTVENRTSWVPFIFL